MGKNKFNNEDRKYLEMLKEENKRLKNDLKAVRRMLQQYNEAQEKGLYKDNEIVQSKKRIKEQELIEKWRCFDCKVGILELIIIGNRYIRKCNNCDRRTKSQIYKEGIEGVRRKK
jgi:hypothetical protein